MKKYVTTLLLLCSLSLSAQMTDSTLFAAYQREDMTVWKEYLESFNFPYGVSRSTELSTFNLLYAYGYCGYIVSEARKDGQESLMPEAKRYVQQFKSQIENQKSKLPAGHYEMYMSAVYVFELRLHESFHPVKAMDLAKQATKLAPIDPLVLSYYGTSLFYAPKPFGSKEEALAWFEKAQARFGGDEWKYCWMREANEMYIRQCHQKLKK